MATSGFAGTSGGNVRSVPIEFTLNDEQAYFTIRATTNSDGTVNLNLVSEFSSEGLLGLQPYLKVRWGGQEYSFKPTNDPHVYEIPELVTINPAENKDFLIFLEDKHGDRRDLYQGIDLLVKSRPTVHELKVLLNTGELPVVNINPKEIKRKQVTHKEVGVPQLRTDLHTHLAAIPTGLELIDMATQGGTRPFYYPIRLLTDARVGISKEEISRFYSDRMTLEQVKKLKLDGIEGQTKGIANQEILDAAKPDEEFVDLNLLTSDHKEKLLKWLSIAPGMQITFDDMEKYYDYREPFTKNIDFIADILEIAAKNFQKSGVKLASLSFSKRSCSPDWFAIIDRELPRLEREYGVTMRFLVGMTRLISEDAQRDTIEEFKRVARHPNIEGIDVFGSEINSTWAFYHVVAELAKWCEENNLSHKVMRIHAGESSYHPENVGAAMRLAKEYAIQVRIGHGLFGSSDDKELMQFYTQNALRDRVTIEMNPDSNYALNHIDTLQSYQMGALAEAGVSLVIGSDGHGLYLTDAKQLADTLSRMDLQSPVSTEEHEYTRIADLVRTTENLEILKAQNAIRRDKANFNADLCEFIKAQLSTLSPEDSQQAQYLIASLERRQEEASYSGTSYNIDQLRQKWVERYIRNQSMVYPAYTRRSDYDRTKSVKLEAEKRRRSEALINKLMNNNSEILSNEESVDALFSRKASIMITGGFDKTEEMDVDDLLKAKYLIKNIIENSDPDHVCFVTTGTNLGLQKYIHQLLELEKQKGKHFDVVGLIAKSAKPESISPVITHAVLGYDKWFDMHGYIGSILSKHSNFKVIAVGGNMLNRNIIQTCDNVRKKARLENELAGELYCINDLPGAARDKSVNLPEEYSVNSQDIARVLWEKHDLSLAASSSGPIWNSHESSLLAIPTSDELYAEINGPMGAVDANDQALFMARYLVTRGLEGKVEDLAPDLLNFIQESEVNPERAAHMPIVIEMLKLDVKGDLSFLEDFKKNLGSLGFDLPKALDDMLKQKRFEELKKGAQTGHVVRKGKRIGQGAPQGEGGSVDAAPSMQDTRQKLSDIQRKKFTPASRTSMQDLISAGRVTAGRSKFTNNENISDEPPKTPPRSSRRKPK